MMMAGALLAAAPVALLAQAQGGAAIAAEERPVLRLSLDAAVKLALERNLDIAVQRLSPGTYDYQIAGLRSVYEPAISGTFGSAKTDNPPISVATGNTTTNTFNGGLTQAVKWGGGSFLMGFNGAQNTSTSIFQSYNPAYNTSYFAQYTQPLLRGFRTDSTRQQLVVTKLNQDVSDIQLQSTIVNTLSNVREAYWNYVYTVEAVNVAKQSLQLSQQLVKDNQARVQLGTMAPLDVSQAQSQAAANQQAVVVAQGQMRTAELALKRLIVAGTQDPNWTATIDPVDRPEFRPEPIDQDAAVRRALAARTDIAQAKKTLEANAATLSFIKDQARPQADALLRFGGTGLAGTELLRAQGLGGPVTSTVVTGFPTSLSSLFTYPQWSASVNISYPLGFNTARASIARSQVLVSQTEAQLHQIELQIATEISNAAISVQSAMESVQAAQAARVFAQREYEAEQAKFNVGMSTNYFVVQAQRDLAAAQINELQGMLTYRNSLVEFDRLQQTTLQTNNVTILGTAGLNTAAVGSGRPALIVQ
jgi:outer membrane protein TolC